MTHHYKITKSGKYYSAINMDTQEVEYGSYGNTGGINGKNRKAVIQKAIDMVEKPATIYLWYISWYEVKNDGVTKPSDVKIIQYSSEIGEIEHNTDLRHDHEKTDITDFSHTHIESEITDLIHDAQKIKGKTVDDSAIGDGKVLKYDEVSGKIVYGVGGGIVIHGNEYHDPDFSIVGHGHYRNEISDFFGSPFWTSIPDKPSTYPPSSHTHLEADITDLVHNAQKIKGKDVDDSAIGDSKVLAYKTASGKIEYVSMAGGGDMLKSVYDTNDDGIVNNSDKLQGSPLSQVQDHLPQIHGNERHEPDFSTIEHGHLHSELSEVTENQHHAKVHGDTEHSLAYEKQSNKGIANGYAGLDASSKVPDGQIPDTITRDTELSTHTTRTDNPHSVTKTQVGLGNVTDDSQLKRADGDINSFTQKATPVANDILLIEDSAASFAKKKITIGSLPSGGGSATPSYSYHRKLGTTRFERWYSCFNTATALTTGAIVANRFYAFPFVVPKTITLDRIAINVTTAGTGNARLGIYNNDDSVGMYPNALVIAAGEVAINSTGIKSITISQQLTAGLYWLVLVSNGTPTLRAFAILSIIPLLGYSASLGAEVAGVGMYTSFTYAALPSTYPTTSPSVIIAVPILAIFVRLSA